MVFCLASRHPRHVNTKDSFRLKWLHLVHWPSRHRSIRVVAHAKESSQLIFGTHYYLQQYHLQLYARGSHAIYYILTYLNNRRSWDKSTSRALATRLQVGHLPSGKRLTNYAEAVRPRWAISAFQASLADRC